MSVIPTIIAHRLVLRPPAPGDLNDLAALGADPEVMRCIGGGQTQTRQEASRWLEAMLPDARFGIPAQPGLPAVPGWLVAVARRPNAGMPGTFIGLACLVPMGPVHAGLAGGGRHVEVGYRLARPFRGQGYATEAATVLARYAFDVLELPRLTAIADERNLASNRVIEKTGLEFRRTHDWSGLAIRFHDVTREAFAAKRALSAAMSRDAM